MGKTVEMAKTVKKPSKMAKNGQKCPTRQKCRKTVKKTVKMLKNRQ